MFETIEGDYFAILGLPLMGLLDLFAALRAARVITGRTIVAGVAAAGDALAARRSCTMPGWAAGIDGVYVAFPLDRHGFQRFVAGLRGGAVRGLNVTIPFKELALALADRATDLAKRSGAANVLTFEPDGRILAHNTDSIGLLQAFAAQAPAWDPQLGPVAVLGAGGAARGAVAALLMAGTPKVFVLNRTLAKAEALAAAIGPKFSALPMAHAAGPFSQARPRSSTPPRRASPTTGALDVPLARRRRAAW